MQQLSGWINLYKPVGVSSAAILRPLKKLLPRKNKIGHAGTLDVAAEGVLPVAIGEATKLVRFTMDAKKEYQFTVQFGSTTDTLDREGEIIEECSEKVSHSACIDVTDKYTGVVKQVPPAYSALKIKGQTAYSLARQGKEVELAERQITIYVLECIAFDFLKQQATYLALCSKGTYIRTLASDIAKSLQNLGFVIELRRLKVGKFTSEDSVRIEDITSENLDKILVEPEAVLDDILGLNITDEIAQQVRHGQLVNVDAPDGQIWLSNQGRLIAVGNVVSERFVSSRVFNL